jgi:anti-anti-sigma factor
MPEETEPTPSEFRLGSTREAERLLVSPHGELDLTTAPELETALLEADDCRELVVDLAAVTFMDSTGLRLLLAQRERARRSGIDFVVTGVDGAVARVLEISGLNPDLSPRDVPRPGANNNAATPRATVRRAPRFSAIYPAEPAAVSELRHAISDYAREAGAGDELISALGLAVSEAATNAVVHAYVGAPSPGTLDIEAGIEDDHLWVSVADKGRGMKPRPDSPGLGLGLPLIAQMTSGFEVREGGAGGTEVFMRFGL